MHLKHFDKMCSDIEQVCRAMAADLKPKDKLALKNTCKILHELFQDEQETWLFPEIFPYLLKHLNKKDVLMARSTCKTWKFAIDGYVENYVVPHGINPHERLGVNIPLEFLWRSRYIHFDSILKIDNFCKTMMNYSSNPFFGSAIEVGMTGLPQDVKQEDYFVIVKKLLDKFGLYVRHLSIFLQLDDIAVYEYFVSWLVQVPNIQSLKVHGWASNGKERTRLDKRLFAIRLPTLPYLHTLNIDCEKVDQDFCTALVYKYQLNLETLCLPLDVLSLIPSNVINFPNLTKVVIYNIYSCIRLLRVYRSHLSSTDNKIQRIELNVDIRLDINDAFEVLNELKVPTVQVKTDTSHYIGLLTSFCFNNLDNKLNFLTSLTISDSVELNYKFLEFLSELKYFCILPIWSDDDEIRCENEMGKRLWCPVDVIIWRCLYVRGCPTKIIWKTLPKLEVFCVSRQIQHSYRLRQFLRSVYENLPDRYFVKSHRCPCTQHRI